MAEKEEGEIVGESDPFTDDEVITTTSEKPVESEDDNDGGDYNEPEITGQVIPDNANITDECRGDDKVRCGTTSTYICGVEKCDGVKNCPNGEDEENCPTTEDSRNVEGSGDENEQPAVEENLDPDDDDEIEEVKISGDFFNFFSLFSKLFF